jgi:hypothetical protein
LLTLIAFANPGMVKASFSSSITGRLRLVTFRQT